MLASCSKIKKLAVLKDSVLHKETLLNCTVCIEIENKSQLAEEGILLKYVICKH